MNFKVFHILGYMAARYGGPPKIAISLGRAMTKYGFDSFWWGTATNNEQQELAHLGDKAFLFPTRFPYSWFRSPELTVELRKRIHEADILHIHQIWDYPLWIAAKLAHKSFKPYIVTTHGIFSHSWRYKSIKKRIYMYLIARSILNNASAIHAANLLEVKAFEKFGLHAQHFVLANGIEPKELQIVPNYNLTFKNWPVLKGKKVVLYLGRLDIAKGLEVLLKSWKHVIKNHPEALLVLAGPDYRGHLDKIKKIVYQYDLQKDVLFTGLIQGEEKISILNHADLFVLPSFSEGFSTAVLEALASGIPCIITESCNFPEIQKSGAGYVIPTGDEKTLSNTICEVMAMSNMKRNEMGKKGKELVMKKYTTDIIAAKLSSIYRCILLHRPVPLYPEADFPL